MQIIKLETAARNYLKCDGEIKGLCVSESSSPWISVCLNVYIYTYIYD